LPDHIGRQRPCPALLFRLALFRAAAFRRPIFGLVIFCLIVFGLAELNFAGGVLGFGRGELGEFGLPLFSLEVGKRASHSVQGCLGSVCGFDRLRLRNGTQRLVRQRGCLGFDPAQGIEHSAHGLTLL